MQVESSPPTATKQRWQPASQVVQVKDLPAVKCVRFAPQQTNTYLKMNNQELIRCLDKHHLLEVTELLSFALMYPDDDFEDWFDRYSIPNEIFDYCGGLTEYQRLKLMQLIINTLIHEAEQSGVEHFQTLLPLKSEG